MKGSRQVDLQQVYVHSMGALWNTEFIVFMKHIGVDSVIQINRHSDPRGGNDTHATTQEFGKPVKSGFSATPCSHYSGEGGITRHKFDVFEFIRDKNADQRSIQSKGTPDCLGGSAHRRQACHMLLCASPWCFRGWASRTALLPDVRRPMLVLDKTDWNQGFRRWTNDHGGDRKESGKKTWTIPTSMCDSLEVLRAQINGEMVRKWMALGCLVARALHPGRSGRRLSGKDRGRWPTG